MNVFKCRKAAIKIVKHLQYIIFTAENHHISFMTVDFIDRSI